MSELPGTWEDILIRHPDMTLHKLQGQAEQYVHLADYVRFMISDVLKHFLNLGDVP